MINLVSPHIETQILLDVDRPKLLVVENPHEYFNTVVDMNNAFNEEDSNFSFWEENDKLNPSKKGEFLLNCFDLDFADKKILNLLYKKLRQNYLDGKLILDFNNISSSIGIFLQDLFQTVSFSLDYGDFDIEDMLKLCAVKPAKTYDSFLEKLVCYINIFIELKNIKFFVLVGIKEILNDQDLLLLYKHCQLQKVALLLIESKKVRQLLPNETAIIITDDLCELVENL